MVTPEFPKGSSFIRRLVWQIRHGSRHVIFHKIKVELRNPHKWPLLPFAIPLVLALRILRPWLLVRWGGLNSWRIGHFAGNTELHLCEIDAGINTPSQRYVDIFFIGRTICNNQLAKMWVRVHRVWPNWIHAPINLANRLIPGGAAHLIPNNTNSDRDVHNLLDRFPAHLDFTPEEENLGQESLRMMGIPKDSPFICLIARDSSYLDSRWPGLWDYHNYRDSNIQHYVLAAEELADRGYFVIRMGAQVREAINSDHPRVIDYATSGMRSDFMDIYLGGNCQFFISGVAGLDAVPIIFRRPVVWVNFVPFIYLPTFSAQYMGITKHHYVAQQDRELSLKEIFSHKAGFFERTADYQSGNIQLIENSPEEIRDVAIEMAERLNHTWKPLEDDDELQKRFWSIYPSDAKSKDGISKHGEIRSRYGTNFLRDNKEWLL